MATKHNWNPTDTQGYDMECSICGLYITIYDAESWDKHLDDICPETKKLDT